MSIPRSICAIVAAACLACASPVASALAPRAFVASYGNDANPCSLALPCRGFAAAIAATSAGGEVIVLDSAGYGTVTITQSVSIIAPAGVYAGISIPGLGTGVTVNAPGSKVVLIGLTINGQATAPYGIDLQNAAELVVDRCTIANNKTAGVFVTAPNSVLTMTDTLIRFTVLGQGIRLNSNVRAVLERVHVLRTVAGLAVFADTAANLTIKDSLIAANFGGVLVSGTGGATASVTIADSVLSDNRGDALKVQSQVSASSTGLGSVMNSMLTRHTSGRGILASSNPPGFAAASASGNVVTQNGDGLATGGAGQLLSARNNTFSRNAGFGLTNSASSTIHTVRGADGLPSNAGEQGGTPTFGTITPVNGF